MPDHARGHPHRDREIRDVTCHHSVCTDHTVAANACSDDARVLANPTAGPDGHGLLELYALMHDRNVGVLVCVRVVGNVHVVGGQNGVTDSDTAHRRDVIVVPKLAAGTDCENRWLPLNPAAVQPSTALHK